jgi:drug/metabolite transporter (DMT)-like permease
MDVPSSASSRRDMVLFVIAVLAFSTAGPLGKVTASIPPVVVACARSAIPALLLTLVAPRALVRALAALTNRQRGVVVLAGALLAGHFVLFLGGLGMTSLAAAVALVSLEPIAVVVAAFLAFGIRPTRRELLGLLVATLGAVVVASGAGVGEHRLVGDLMVLAAVAVYGAYVASARGVRDAMPSVQYSAAVFGTTSLVLLPLAAVLGRKAGLPAGKPMLGVVAMGLLPTLIGHSLVQRVARRASPLLAALVSPGETVGSLAIGALLMGAAPTPREGVGCALVLIGSLVAMTARR